MDRALMAELWDEAVAIGLVEDREPDDVFPEVLDEWVRLKNCVDEDAAERLRHHPDK